MKYILTFVVIQLFTISLHAQLKEEVELNLPEVPTSPAFILMGNSPSEIESPQTPADLNLSLQNASENFMAIPKNYSLSVAPYWLFRFKETSYTDWARGSAETRKTIGNNILQSLQISVGVSDSIANKSRSNRFGAGFNFSIIRGNIDSVVERKYFDKLKNLNTEVQSLQALAEVEDKLYNELEDALNEVVKSRDVLLEDTSRSLQEEEELEGLEEQANIR